MGVAYGRGARRNQGITFSRRKANMNKMLSTFNVSGCVSSSSRVVQSTLIIVATETVPC